MLQLRTIQADVDDNDDTAKKDIDEHIAAVAVAAVVVANAAVHVHDAVVLLRLLQMMFQMVWCY